MTTSCEVAVFISNYTDIDPEVYKIWVDGFPSSDAVNMLHRKENQLNKLPKDMLAADVLDHYRTYHMLEKLLHYPIKLQTQIAFQLKSETRNFLIEKYYDLDSSVVREFLGKKLSSKHRKDLDEVSEKTEVSLKSCRRQFDNVKRIFKTVDDLPGSVVQNIRRHFLLPEELAKKYAVVVFISSIRFETSKRKLQYLTFNDFYICILSMMINWTNINSIENINNLNSNTNTNTHSMNTSTTSSIQDGTVDEFDDKTIDTEFLLELRELRNILFEKEKEHKHIILSILKSQITTSTKNINKKDGNLSQEQVQKNVNIQQNQEQIFNNKNINFSNDEYKNINLYQLNNIENINLSQQTYNDLEYHYKYYSRSIIHLCINVHRNKELRNLFLEIYDKFVTSFKYYNINLNDIKYFLYLYTNVYIKLIDNKNYKNIYKRFMSVINQCIITMYHN